MKYERMGILPQIFLNLLNRRQEAVRLNHRLLYLRREIPQMPTDEEATWVLNPVWTLRREKNLFPSVGNRTRVPWMYSS